MRHDTDNKDNITSDDKQPSMYVNNDAMFYDNADTESEEELTDADGKSEYIYEESSPNSFGMFIKLLLSPVEGWKAIRRSSVTPEKWGQECFYPLLALLAVATFATRIYIYVSLEELLTTAVVKFISFFFGYFIITILCKFLLPGRALEAIDRNFGKVFIMASLSSLALFSSLLAALPMLEPLLVFLPLWTTYLIYKGVRFLRINDNRQALTVIMLSFLVIGVPLLLGWIFGLVMP